MKTDTLTFIIGIFFLPIWLVWELVLAKWKGQGIDVDLISQVMRERAYQMNALPFFWSAMLVHWWVNRVSLPRFYDMPHPAVAFWLIQVLTLALDVWLWSTPYNTLHPVLKFYRAPAVQCAVGAISAYMLFPQKMLLMPGWRWW